MMQENHTFKFTALAGLLLIALLPSCSDRGVNGDDTAVSVSMSLKVASPGMLDAISQFRVAVTADDIDPAITAPLLLTGRYLQGVVVVPPGKGRTFTVEASDFAGVVLYRGDTTINVGALEIIQLVVNLYPVVSLVRVSPRYMEVPANSNFAVDVRAFNVKDLYGITFRLHWQQAETVVYPDSARPLLPVGTDALFFDRIDPVLRFYEITVSNSDQLTPIVDSNGDADLVRIFFSSFAPELLPQASLSMEVREMTRLPADTISLDSVKADGSMVVVQFPLQ